VMLSQVLRDYPESEIVATFANTGLEHEKTLRYVRNVGDFLGVDVVWLEAVIGGPGVGIRHKIVDFETASRDGQPFRDLCAKYGIPGPSHPQCTSRLKTEVMESYLLSIGWRKNSRVSLCDTAIGIRADEMDRVNARFRELRLFYPLLDAGLRRYDVNRIAAEWPFALDLPEHLGNCVLCWKKSDKKLRKAATDEPGHVDHVRRMERDFGLVKIKDKPRRFYRKHRTIDDVIGGAIDLDDAGACGAGSCEPYGEQLDMWEGNE
jgi:hypothetical protein